MGTVKAKWKRAPKDQRRMTADRTIPNARFARKQLSGSLPPSLPTRSRRRPLRPLLIFTGALVLMVGLGITLVIAVGSYIRSEQQFNDIQQRAAYYGRPTLPFSTLAPDFGQAQQQVVGTTAPYLTTPLPGQSSPILAAPDDPRWVRGSVTPINGSFDLRSIPAVGNNNPLETISQPISCSFIIAGEWGTWAQIEVGSVIAWVDTSTVSLKAAS